MSVAGKLWFPALGAIPAPATRRGIMAGVELGEENMGETVRASPDRAKDRPFFGVVSRPAL